MVKEPFVLEWLGGLAESRFRKLRPGVDDLPWGSLDTSGFSPLVIDRARVAWTEAAVTEYATAAAFADIVHGLLAAKAPIDLVGMTSDFVADEVLHVELTSRMAMELGGGAPYEIDFEALTIRPSLHLLPQQRASEMILRTCVAEALSVPLLHESMEATSQPIARAVLERIAKDEAPHGELVWLYLDWAQEEMDDPERRRLARIAHEVLERARAYWSRLRSRAPVAEEQELGWMTPERFDAAQSTAIRERIASPLAGYGIVLDERVIERLLVVPDAPWSA
jgi:hypothetical protein